MNFVLGMNGGHMPSSLGSRLIDVVRQAGWQADKMLSVYNFLKFNDFNSKACLGCLNEFMVPIASYQ